MNRNRKIVNKWKLLLLTHKNRMLLISQISAREFLVDVPVEWNGNVISWMEILPALTPYIDDEVTFFVDMGKIDELPGIIFNSLYELASSINEHRSKLVFINIHEAISERIALLNFSAE